MRSWGIAAALLLGLPFSAQAQSVEQVFQNFGLIGVWADACNQPAQLENGNSRAIYALSSSDGVMLTYDYGTKYAPAVYTIVSAQLVGRDRVSYVEERVKNKARVNVTLHKANDRITVISSVAQEGGKVFVENGMIVSNGQPAPSQTRCP
jgi:hypothetical protein